MRGVEGREGCVRGGGEGEGVGDGGEVERQRGGQGGRCEGREGEDGETHVGGCGGDDGRFGGEVRFGLEVWVDQSGGAAVAW